MPSEEIETFISLARMYLAKAEAKISLGPITAAERSEILLVLDSVQAAIKMRAVSLDAELELIDRELEGQFGASMDRR